MQTEQAVRRRRRARVRRGTALAAALFGWLLTATPAVPAGPRGWLPAAAGLYGTAWWQRPAARAAGGLPRRVRLGGLSIGVVVRVRGLVVLGVDGQDPAAQAGIRPGEVITAAQGQPLRSRAQLAALTAAAGRAHRGVELEVADGGSLHRIRVRPVRAPGTRGWRLGVTVQARFSGVGTLSFWSADGRRFVALGHSVVRAAAGPVPVEGAAYPARVVDIVPSTPGEPGEKIGVLNDPPQPLGRVERNGRFGISGRTEGTAPGSPLLPLAAPTEVHPGPAWLYTALRGSRPQRFRVRVLMTLPQDRPRQRGILFQVTDPRLLSAAGGIVQGMSGSPLVQDGRVIGAVTHVLVNRPQLGYACYAAWMARDAGWGQHPGTQNAKTFPGRQESRRPAPN
ncbi:MAG: PDZ domain-containing protein [Firmicutes bacterium]|nr:PDZ domain-containing protein [Bacillota bacterium]